MHTKRSMSIIGIILGSSLVALGGRGDRLPDTSTTRGTQRPDVLVLARH